MTQTICRGVTHVLCLERSCAGSCKEYDRVLLVSLWVHCSEVNLIKFVQPRTQQHPCAHVLHTTNTQIHPQAGFPLFTHTLRCFRCRPECIGHHSSVHMVGMKVVLWTWLNHSVIHIYTTLVIIQTNFIQIKLRWALFVTYTIIQSIMRSEMCSLHLTHPSVHTWSSGQSTLRRPGKISSVMLFSAEY